MAQLSNREKEELQQAVDRVLDHCSEGCMPNDAIIKTAQEMHLTPDRLPILVNAYNAGATAEHWSHGTTVREKTASFPIADLEKIRQRLYPAQVKKASAKLPPKDNAFFRSPASIFNQNPLDCYKDRTPFQKTASVATPGELLRAKTKLQNRVWKSAALCQQGLAQIRGAMAYDMDKLAGILKRPGMPSYDTLCKTAAAVFGEVGTLIMQAVGEDYPSVKKASYMAVSDAPLKDNHPFFTQMRALADEMNTFVQSAVLNKQASDMANNVQARLDEGWKTELYGSEMRRVLLSPEEGGRRHIHALLKNAAEDSRAEDLSRLETMLHPEWQGVTEREHSYLDALSDPAHNAKLRQISNETMLTDLLNTDEYLKEQDPEAVLEAYNDLLEAAPNLQGKKMLIRQALREYMSSETLDLATLGQIAKMDNDAQTAKDRKEQMRADQAAQYYTNRQRHEEVLADRELRQTMEEMRWAVQKQIASSDRASRAGIAAKDRAAKAQIAAQEDKTKRVIENARIDVLNAQQQDLAEHQARELYNQAMEQEREMLRADTLAHINANELRAANLLGTHKNRAALLSAVQKATGAEQQHLRDTLDRYDTLTSNNMLNRRAWEGGQRYDAATDTWDVPTQTSFDAWKQTQTSLPKARKFDKLDV